MPTNPPGKKVVLIRYNVILKNTKVKPNRMMIFPPGKMAFSQAIKPEHIELSPDFGIKKEPFRAPAILIRFKLESMQQKLLHLRGVQGAFASME